MTGIRKYTVHICRLLRMIVEVDTDADVDVWTMGKAVSKENPGRDS